MKQNTFRDLEAYKYGKCIIKEVYDILALFPIEEKFALCDQLRRAAISITSNIAEGSGRVSVKEKIHFIEISFGSLMEVISQLDIAVDLGYITPERFYSFEIMADKEARLISGLKNHFQSSLTSNPSTP